MTLNQKAVSATAIAGTEDCPDRWLEENFLKSTWTPEELSADDRARKRGLIFHQAVETANKGKMKGLPMEEEQIKALVLATGLGQADATDLYEGMAWHFQRMMGIVPVAVEDDGARWETEIGGIRVVGKYDMAHVNAESGRMTVVDYKSNWVPDKALMLRATQPRIYAWSARRTYGTAADVSIVSIGQRFSFLLEYSDADIDAFTPFLEDRIKKCADVILTAEAEPDKARLKGTAEFSPKLNGWCSGCSIRKRCLPYKALIWTDPEGANGSRPAALEGMRVRAKLIGKELDRVSDDLKASASECGADGFTEDGYKVVLVSRVDKLPAKPSTERVIQTLRVTKDDAVAVPKGKKGRKS